MKYKTTRVGFNGLEISNIAQLTKFINDLKFKYHQIAPKKMECRKFEPQWEEIVNNNIIDKDLPITFYKLNWELRTLTIYHVDNDDIIDMAIDNFKEKYGTDSIGKYPYELDNPSLNPEEIEEP